MRALRRLTPVALLVAATFLLSGCVEPEPEVVPPPEETTAPVFASDEEALAAATDAYEAYLAMSDLIAQEGGANPERIAQVATREAVDDASAGFETFRNQNLHSVGSSVFDGAVLQQYESSGVGQDVAAMYVCLDISAVDVVNNSGTSVVEPSRPDRQPFEVFFDSVPDIPAKLLVSSRNTWGGGLVCGS